MWISYNAKFDAEFEFVEIAQKNLRKKLEAENVCTQ
jgi:hypothetical protein